METTLVRIVKPSVDTSLHFSTVTLKAINDLKDILNRYPSRSCDYTLGGIIIWVDYFDYQYCIFNDTLFLKGKDSKGEFFHLPLGRMNEAEAQALVKDYCAANAIPYRMIVPREISVEDMSEEVERTEGYLAGWREYMYDIDRFTYFSGKKMEKKRNHLNYFMNHYGDYEMEILDGSQTKALFDFNDKFNLYHKDGDTFDYESRAIGDAIDHYMVYPFFGLLLKYKGEIIGYTFGEKSGDAFVIHAEKGDIEYRGVYQALASLLAREITERFPEVKYLNREDDMDNDYLRQSKLSYHPTKFIVKWEKFA